MVRQGKNFRVEVSVDGGMTWGDAALEGPIQTKMLTRFRIPWLWRADQRSFKVGLTMNLAVFSQQGKN